MVEGDWSAESGMAAVRGLPDRDRATAVMAANDLVAAGAIRAAMTGRMPRPAASI